jgi:membrane-bound inhibitor of C-type lysozyme
VGLKHHPFMPPLRTAALAALLLAACAHHEQVGPAGIPYACAGGRPARIYYEGGGYYPRASARLVYDGRDIHLDAVPPTYGLRYVSADDAPILIWSARGEEAWLSALDSGQGEEREIAHCIRVRAGSVADLPHRPGRSAPVH